MSQNESVNAKCNKMQSGTANFAPIAVIWLTGDVSSLSSL